MSRKYPNWRRSTVDVKDMIYSRRSVRKYLRTSVSDDTIEDIVRHLSSIPALDEDISIRCDILGADEVSVRQPWRAPHYLAIYSEPKPRYRQNVGYIYQQLDLYVQSIGLGSCWVGLGKPKDSSGYEGYEFVILIALGYADQIPLRKIGDFKRKPLEEISDTLDERLEPVRLAPSATNSQPWYFTHLPSGDMAIYRKKQPKLIDNVLGKFNEMDIGIALAHLYISYPLTFEYEYIVDTPSPKGYIYEGTIRI